MSAKTTGVTYEEEKMLEHKSLWDSNHPERPQRLSSILARCRELELLERCEFIEPRFAKEEELTPLHDKELVDLLRTSCDLDFEGNLEAQINIALKYEAIYFHPSTNQAALLASGATIDLVKGILEGNIRNGMALIRPPGHHAMKSAFCGFCFFNNAAIGAYHALASGIAKKVLIVDFDVHHGQGIQQMFYNDPRVLYFSTHRYEHGNEWPNLAESNCDWIGSGDGSGFNCNIPLNKPGMGNSEFLTIWYSVLIPMAYQFNPDLVIISAGFDAALNDPLGLMEITPQCYPHLVSSLMGLANGKVAALLEGGYCLKALSEGAALVLRTLLGDPCPMIAPISEPMPEIVETILSATVLQRQYWPILSSCVSESDEDQVHDLPQLRYDWTEPKPEVNFLLFPFPVDSFENKSPFDQKLLELIANTNLSVASERVIILESPQEILNKMNRGEIQSGIGILSKNQRGKGMGIALEISKTASAINLKILIVTLDQQSLCLRIAMQNAPNDSSQNNFDINLGRESEDTEYFAAFTHLVMPIAYEFSPDLVIFVIEPVSRSKLSQIGIAHLTHFLKPLANGKMIILTEENDMAELQANVLRGVPLPRLILKKSIIQSAAKEIVKIRRDLQDKWTVLKPFCKRIAPETKFEEKTY